MWEYVSGEERELVVLDPNDCSISRRFTIPHAIMVASYDPTSQKVLAGGGYQKGHGRPYTHNEVIIFDVSKGKVVFNEKLSSGEVHAVSWKNGVCAVGYSHGPIFRFRH